MIHREIIAAGASLAGQVMAASKVELRSMHNEIASGTGAEVTVDQLHRLRAEFTYALEEVEKEL